MSVYNQLTSAEIERLAILAEEASEVVKACMKILCHGYASINPDAPEKGSNTKQLEQKLADLRLAEFRLISNADISVRRVEEAMQKKCLKPNYTHHQGE